MKLKRILLTTSFIAIALAPFSTSVYAASGQYFSMFTFTNPAELSLLLLPYKDPITGETVTQHQQLTIGEQNVWYDINYTGTSGPVTIPSLIGTGSVDSNNYYALWSLAYAARLNDKLVFGLNVGHPFQGEVTYPQDAFTRFAATKFWISNWDFSPSLAYQFDPYFSVGGGLDFQRLWGLISNVVPLRLPPAFNVSEHAFNTQVVGWGYGWHIGMLLHPLKGTFLNLFYYSNVPCGKLSGPSNLEGYPSTTSITHVTLPATTSFKVFQAFTPRWGITGRVDYTVWSTVQNIIFDNTALFNRTINLAYHFRNTWRYVLALRYAPPKWVIAVGASLNETPTRVAVSRITNAENNYPILGFDVTREITKNIKFGVNYYHSFIGKIHLNNVQNGVLTNGTTDISSDHLELRLTFLI